MPSQKRVVRATRGVDRIDWLVAAKAPLETTRPSLLLRVQDLNDHASWREFDARYREVIVRYCRRKGLQTSDAEDVRQMVMLNLARQMRSFEYQPKRGRFRNYLGRTVSNAIHRYYRRPTVEKGGLELSEAGEVEAPRDDALDQAWETEWMLHHYRTAMAQVRESSDAKSVEVFEHLLSGRTTDEVAGNFDMSRDAVHKVKQRMRDRLKRQIAEQIAEDEAAV